MNPKDLAARVAALPQAPDTQPPYSAPHIPSFEPAPHHPSTQQARRDRPVRPRRGRPSSAGLFRIAKKALHLLLAIALGIGVAAAARLWVVESFYVPSESMSPTLITGDRLIAEKLTYKLGEPRRGDVVVFRAHGSWQDLQGEYFVKRVVAVGGDTVKCCDKKRRVLVNGVPAAETYLPAGKQEKFRPVRVPEGRLFVMGDHRGNSEDSRYRGAVDAGEVVGKVAFRVWPLTRLGRVTTD